MKPTFGKTARAGCPLFLNPTFSTTARTPDAGRRLPQGTACVGHQLQPSHTCIPETRQACQPPHLVAPHEGMPLPGDGHVFVPVQHDADLHRGGGNTALIWTPPCQYTKAEAAQHWPPGDGGRSFARTGHDQLGRRPMPPCTRSMHSRASAHRTAQVPRGDRRRRVDKGCPCLLAAKAAACSGREGS